MRKFYGIPEEEIPYSAYEFDKVKSLASRISTTRDAGSRNNVHIISGRESLQVRRIAYLTAKSIEDTGAVIIPVDLNGNNETHDISKTADPVFLIDEFRLIEDSSDENSDPVEILSDVIARAHKMARNGHSILLSLSQDTYESHFRSAADGDGTITYREKAVEDKVKVSARKGEKEHNLGKYWAGAVLLSVPLVISPVLHSVATFSNYTLSGKSGVDADLREALVLLTAAFTIAGLVYMALSSRNLKGRARAIGVSGIAVFSAEALIPLVLYMAGIFPPPSHPVPGSVIVVISYLSPSSVLRVFVMFQSIAAVSFFLIPYTYTGKYGKAVLFAAFVASEAFLLLSAGEAQAYFNPLLPLHINTLFIVPYNTPVFALFYNQVYFLHADLLAAAYISQWLFAAMYIQIGLRNRTVWWKNKDNEVTALTGRL